MKVRIIIECEDMAVGKFLSVMPGSATFTITRIHPQAMPKLGPMGQRVIKEIVTEKPKKSRRTGLPRAKDIILKTLRENN